MARLAYPPRNVRCGTHAVRVPSAAPFAEYDGRTISGPWAYMCEECFVRFGVGLGTGKGQRLVIMERRH